MLPKENCSSGGRPVGGSGRHHGLKVQIGFMQGCTSHLAALNSGIQRIMWALIDFGAEINRFSGSHETEFCSFVPLRKTWESLSRFPLVFAFLDRSYSYPKMKASVDWYEVNGDLLDSSLTSFMHDSIASWLLEGGKKFMIFKDIMLRFLQCFHRENSHLNYI